MARDLDFLRDEERASLAYDDARHGFRLTDETYALPLVRISCREAFNFGLARKLLAHYEGTPLHLDLRSVLDKIAESLEGDITIEPDWLSEHVGVLPEDRVRIDPEVWVQLARYIEPREAIRYAGGPGEATPVDPARRKDNGHGRFLAGDWRRGATALACRPGATAGELARSVFTP